jgi:hypothetical protein
VTIFRPSQPTSVTTGVLPLAAKTHGEAGEIDRAAFLLSTLDRRWQDKTPLRLIIVAPSDDVPAIGNALQSTPRVQVDLRTEEEFFDRDEAFQALPGWWKQQVIKLVVPAVLRLGPYLTFDADVVCLRDFDGRTFVREGQLVSQWYRQYRNGWWAATARFLGLPYEPSALGLDVTPNVLHSDLAARVIRRLAWRSIGIVAPGARELPARLLSQLALLGLDIAPPGVEVAPRFACRAATRLLHQWYEEVQARRRAGEVLHEDTWTEYSLYTLLSGKGLQHRHAPPSDDMPLLAHPWCVWYPIERERLGRFTTEARPGAPFVVIQSTSGVSLAEVKAAVGRLP